MRIERHVFGSFRGYTTLAKSPGVSADDSRQLEGSAFAFGQSDDRRYLKSLKGTPAYFTRLLSGGRRGLTRVLHGTPDDNGRPTLCMITAVVAQRDWDAQLCGDVARLLEDPPVWDWDAGTELPPLDRDYPLPPVNVSRKSVPRLLALVAELERNFASRQPTILAPDDYGPAELRAIEMLIPPTARPRFTSACRALNPQLPVTVNLLAEEAGSQRVTFRYDGGAPPNSPFSEFLRDTELSEGRVPLAEVLSYQSFGRAERPPDATARAAAHAASPVERIVSRAPRWLWPVGLAGCAVVGAVGWLAGSRYPVPAIRHGVPTPVSAINGTPATTQSATTPAMPQPAASAPADAATTPSAAAAAAAPPTTETTKVTATATQPAAPDPRVIELEEKLASLRKANDDVQAELLNLHTRVVKERQLRDQHLAALTERLQAVLQTLKNKDERRPSLDSVPGLRFAADVLGVPASPEAGDEQRRHIRATLRWIEELEAADADLQKLRESYNGWPGNPTNEQWKKLENDVAELDAKLTALGQSNAIPAELSEGILDAYRSELDFEKRRFSARSRRTFASPASKPAEVR